MGNHSDDCPDCGSDRRGSVFACCAKEEARIVEARRQFAREQERRRALFNRLGIQWAESPNYSGQFEVMPRLSSLLSFLESLPKDLRREPPQE